MKIAALFILPVLGGEGILMQLEPRSLASRWSEEEKRRRKEGARTEPSKAWQEPRTPGPKRGPLPLPRPSGGRAISGEAGMLASICHDGLISGSRVHWRDLIRGACLTFGAADVHLAGLIKPRGAASSPSGSLSLPAWGPSRGGSWVGHRVLSPVGSDGARGRNCRLQSHTAWIQTRFSHLLNCVTMPETSLSIWASSVQWK